MIIILTIMFQYVCAECIRTIYRSRFIVSVSI